MYLQLVTTLLLLPRGTGSSGGLEGWDGAEGSAVREVKQRDEAQWRSGCQNVKKQITGQLPDITLNAVSWLQFEKTSGTRRGSQPDPLHPRGRVGLQTCNKSDRARGTKVPFCMRRSLGLLHASSQALCKYRPEPEPGRTAGRAHRLCWRTKINTTATQQ